MHDPRVTAVESVASSAQVAAATAQSGDYQCGAIASHGSRLDAVESVASSAQTAAATAQSGVTTNAGAISALEGRVTAVEGTATALQAAVDQINHDRFTRFDIIYTLNDGSTVTAEEGVAPPDLQRSTDLVGIR